MKRATCPERRRGFLLIVVMVAIALLSLSLYSFSETMLAEYRVVRQNIQFVQQTQIAKSAIEVARKEIANRDVRSRFRLLSDSEVTSGQLGPVEGVDASYALVHLRDNEANLPFPSFAAGLANESGKLNINSLPLELSRADEARARLTALPGISLAIADAILDWRDSDDQPRSLGAETGFYSALGYRPRQGPIRSMAELLQVRGITPELLYGEDANANGWMEPNENDGNRSAPRDDADGQLDRGLSAWITVDGAESTLAGNGVSKVNVNGDSLLSIYDRLLPLLGERGALFVAAYRLEGPLEPTVQELRNEEADRQRRRDSAEARLRMQLGAEDPFAAPRLSAKDSFRGGMDLSRSGTFPIRSLFDLIGSRVLVTIGTEQEVLESPWQRDPQSVASVLPLLEANLTTVASKVRRDRINPTAASRAVLRTLPDISDAEVLSILKACRRMTGSVGTSRRSSSIAWLMTDAGIRFERLRKFAPYLTMGGDFFRGYALGRLDGAEAQAVIGFRLDATLPRARLHSIQSLRPIPIP